MPYLLKRGNTYYYYRRVPKKVRPYFDKNFVRRSLDTDSPKLAEELSLIVNQEVENQWAEFMTLGTSCFGNDHQLISKKAEFMGFKYRPLKELQNAPLHKIINRLNVLPEVSNEPDMIEALMGTVEAPSYSMSQALEVYWNISRHEIVKKSDEQVRKWRNPIIKAVRNFIQICGDKPIESLSREDIITFRDWWLERVKQDGVAIDTVNKEVRFIKKVLSAVSDHHKLDIDIEWIFKKYSIRGGYNRRAAFETEVIRNSILDINRHKTLNNEAMCFLFAMASTGARPSELVALEREDIILDSEIPHIKIIEKPYHQLKTKDSERDIPLVGSALWAFQQLPNGFTHYRNLKAGSSSLSATLMKHLRKEGLIPTKKHSVYSLRHSFRERMDNNEFPDRIQNQLFGHTYKGIKYGDGASLETLHEWISKICFQAPE